MSYVRISNESFFDKNYYSTFVNQEEYKFFNISSGTSTLVPMYQELLREVIGDDVDTTFKDRSLTTSETIQIQTIFEQKIDDNIPNREIDTENRPYEPMTWKGAVYNLNLSLTNPINRRLWDFYKIVQICKECLGENKPMYLSIE